MNICVQGFVFMQVFISLGYTPRNRIVRSNFNSLFNHLRNCQTVSQSSWIIWHSHQRCLRDPTFCPLISTSYYLSFHKVTLVRKQHLIVVLICIALMPSDAGYLFRGLFLMTVVIRESIILEEEFSRYKGSGTQKHDSLCAIISFRPQNHNKSLFLPTMPSVLEC